MATNPLDLGARGAELRRQVAGWEDDARRLERRREELDAERTQIEQRLAITVEGIEAAERKLEDARQELERIEELTGKPVPQPKLAAAPNGRPTLNEDQVRAAILRFQGGTVADVVAYLRRKPSEVEPLMQAEADRGVIRFTGQKIQRSAVWEYVPPSEPGAAFRVQQEQRAAESPDPTRSLPVAGVGDGLLALLAKDVRKVARRWVNRGWTLVETGGNHMQLIPPDGGEAYTFAKTPQNPSTDARKMESWLRRRAADQVQRRGAPVAGTGKPLQRSGNVSRRQMAGKRVVKRK